MKRPVEAIIEDVIVEPSKIHPIIVNFQNGELKDEEVNKMSCGLFYDKNKQKTLLALSNGQIVYKGYKPDTKKDLTRTMLVLHNKRTGRVRLVEVERWQFGSKKVKRRTEQYERLKVNVESVKEQLEKTVSHIEIDRVDLATPLPNNEYITNTGLPHCNRDAVNVKDVYNLYDIIPKDKLKTLYEKATEALESDTQGTSKFYVHTMKHLKLESNNVKKMAILMYIEAICAWLRMPIKDGKRKKIEVCPGFPEISSYILDTYSVASAHGRLRPSSVKDKAVIHCMILALIICNFVLDIELFTTILNNRMGMKKLTNLARLIGAVPSKEDKKIISLKVPLPAQAPIVRKGKKK
ncbi:hypothetical protein KM043_018263 [Ampulex compressa]|nr:hypothetical protein KM043_018263 [Ampulex compressa]